MRAVLWPSFLCCRRWGGRRDNTEELLVYALGESERKRRENQENVRRLTIALAQAGEAFRAATARAERANIIVEALAESARIHGDGGEKPSKRGRYE
jgi:hypothetical protein